MSKANSLRTGVVFTYLYNIVHIVVNLVNVPILTTTLGKSEYGLYNIVGAFFAYINVLEASLAAGTLRYYCKARAGGDQTEIENVLGICRKIYRILSASLLVMGAAVIFVFRGFYANAMTPAEIEEGTWMLVILFASLLVTLLNAVYFAGIQANEKFVFIKLTAIVSQLLQPVLFYLLVRSLPHAITVVVIQLALNLAIALVRYVYASRSLNIRAKIHQKDRELEKAILLFSGSVLLAQIADQIFWKTDQIILGKLYNTALVAVYSVAAHIYINYMVVGVTVASVFFPRVSRIYHEDGNMKRISELFISVGRISFLLCFLVLTGFVIFGREFLSIWVGDGFQDAYGIALLVMVPFTIDICQNLGLTIIQVTNQYTFRAKMYFVAAVLNIVSTAVLAYYYAGFGAALSTGITMVLTSGVIMNVFYAREVKLDISGYWKNISVIGLRLLPLAAAAYAADKMAGRGSVAFFAFKILLYVLVYGLCAYFAVLNQGEKGIVDKMLGRIRRLV